MLNLVRMSVYHKPSSDLKRAQEAEEIIPFVLGLQNYLLLDDVEFAADPPDFIFSISGKQIGVELTDLDPKIFVKGGYLRRGEFKLWEKEAKDNPQPYHEFSWGNFSDREALAAFNRQFDEKCEKVKKWKENFPEKWLVAHVAGGSPFGEILPAREKITPGKEDACADHKAKLIYSLFSICQKPHPFDYVILFCGQNLFPFPANGKNPHKLPFAKPEVLDRGAKVSDEFLDWSGELKSCKRQLSLEEIKSGKVNPPF